MTAMKRLFGKLRRLDIFEMSQSKMVLHILIKRRLVCPVVRRHSFDGQSRFMSEIAYKAMTYACCKQTKCNKNVPHRCLSNSRSCGVMPGAVKAVADHYYQPDKSTVVKGFLAASGIGNVVANRACVAGAVGGCQAEIGTAACMAAGLS